MTGVDPFEERVQQNRIARNNRIYERQQIARRQRSPQEHAGYDAATGLHRLRGVEGDRLVSSIATGGLEAGAIVRSGPGSVGGLEAAQRAIREAAKKILRVERDYVFAANTFIRKIIMPAGRVVTLAGQLASGNVDGAAKTEALLDDVRSLCIVGNTIFFTSLSGHVVRKLESGVVTTIAGAYEELGTTDGVGGAARFTLPDAIEEVWGGLLLINESNISLSTFRLLDPFSFAVTTMETTPQIAAVADFKFDLATQKAYVFSVLGVYTLDQDGITNLIFEEVLAGGPTRFEYGYIIGDRLWVSYVRRQSSPLFFSQSGIMSMNKDGSDPRVEFSIEVFYDESSLPRNIVSAFFVDKSQVFIKLNQRLDFYQISRPDSSFIGNENEVGDTDGLRTNARLRTVEKIFPK